MRRLIAIVVATTLLAVGAATRATTARAAASARIAFATWPGCGSCGGVFVANADGRGQLQLAHNSQDLVQSTSAIDPSWSPDARRVAYASNHCLLPFCDVPTGAVRIANVDGSGDREVVSLSKMSIAGTAWSPVGRRIAFAARVDAPWEVGAVCWCGLQAGHAEIFVVGDDGAGLTPVAAGHRPSWSPDGSRIAFYGPDGGVYVVNATGLVHGIRRISPPGFVGVPSLVADAGWAGGPAWSPDGARVAIVGNIATDPAAVLDAFGWIYVVNSDGSDADAARWRVRGAQPTWSPDSAQLAYLDSGGIEARAVGNGQARLVVASDADSDSVFYPSWSPDGGSIAYAQYSRNGRWSIWRVAPDGSSHELVTNALSNNSAIAPMLTWSP